MAVRLLEWSDVPGAMALSTEAGWNQTAEDWRALLDWDRAGCLGIDCEEELAATATLVCYGAALGWIGMVLTSGRFRRRGFARTLLEAALDIADGRGVETLKLDATEMGQPLYESVGFAAEQAVERWQGVIREERTSSGCCGDWGRVAAEVDREIFGADRGAMLESLARRGLAVACEAGFAMSREGRVARYLGPCAARDQESARFLIRSGMRPGGVWFWDLLPGNAGAVEIARELGFTCVRRLVRMSRGKARRGRDECVFAIGGFEIG